MDDNTREARVSAAALNRHVPWPAVSKRLLFAVSVSVLLLLLCEGIIRVGAWLTDRQRVFVSNRVAGYGCRPFLHMQRKRYGESVFRYSTDEFGYRVTSLPGDSRRGRRIVLLGDSFAFGWCVNDEDSLGYILSERSGRPVVNISCNGYAPDTLSVLLSRCFAGTPRGQEDDIGNVVLLISENDFVDITLRRSEGRAKPYFEEGGEGYVLHGPRLTWTDWVIDHSTLAFLLQSNLMAAWRSQSSTVAHGESPRLMFHIVRAMNAECERRGVPLDVVLFQNPEGPLFASRPRDIFITMCTRSGIDARDITSEVRDDKGRYRPLLTVDGQHWNRRGNARVADILLRVLEARDTQSPSPEGGASEVRQQGGHSDR